MTFFSVVFLFLKFILHSYFFSVSDMSREVMMKLWEKIELLDGPEWTIDLFKFASKLQN